MFDKLIILIGFKAFTLTEGYYVTRPMHNPAASVMINIQV